MITANLHSLREGNVFSRVSLSTCPKGEGCYKLVHLGSPHTGGPVGKRAVCLGLKDLFVLLYPDSEPIQNINCDLDYQARVKFLLKVDCNLHHTVAASFVNYSISLYHNNS